MFDSMIQVSVRLLFACLALVILRRTLLKNAYSKYILMMWIPVFIAFIYPRGFLFEIEKTVHVNQSAFFPNTYSNQVLNAENHYHAILQSINWNSIVYSIWIIGMIISAIVFIIRQVRLKAMIQKCKPLSDVQFAELLQDLDFTLCCVEHSTGTGAAITCTLSPVLIIFENSFSLSEIQKRMMLQHEFVHYEKRHYLIKYLIQILKVIWWFHPGIWILENEISRELEFRCDEILIENKDISLKDYAELMIVTQSGLKMSDQLGLSAKAKRTKERIEKCMMKKKKHLLLGTLAVVIMSGYLLVQVRQTVKAQTNNDISENIQLNNDYVNQDSITVTLDDLLAEMISPIENAEITCGYGCYAGHQETDVINTENRKGNIYSVLDGIVIACDYNSEDGNFIVVEHGLGVQTHYHHLDRQYVQIGDRIEKGDCIGVIGKTGMATGLHLGFTVTVNDEAINIDDLFR